MYRLEFVFRNDPDPDDPAFFEDVMAAIETLRPLGWTFDFESEEAQVDGHIQLVWVERIAHKSKRRARLVRNGTSRPPRRPSRSGPSKDDDLATVTLHKDTHTEICTLAVSAPRSSDVRTMSESLMSRLDFESLDELLEQARTNLTLAPMVLVKIALTLGDRQDPESLEILRTALEHRFPHVRYYAAYGAALTLWPAFIPDLQRLLKLEPDQDVQEMAERALNGCQREVRTTARR